MKHNISQNNLKLEPLFIRKIVTRQLPAKMLVNGAPCLRPRYKRRLVFINVSYVTCHYFHINNKKVEKGLVRTIVRK